MNVREVLGGCRGWPHGEGKIGKARSYHSLPEILVGVVVEIKGLAGDLQLLGGLENNKGEVKKIKRKGEGRLPQA